MRSEIDLNDFKRSDGRSSVAFDIFVVVYLVALMGFFASLQSIIELPVSSVVYFFLYSFTLYFFYIDRRYIDFSRFLNWFYLLFTGLIASAIFSYARFGSFFSILIVFLNFLFAFIVARRISPSRLGELVLFCLVFVLVVSFFFGLVNVDFVIYSDPIDRSYVLGIPNIKGLFPHKIHAGIFFGMGAYLSFRRARVGGFLWWALFVIFSVGVILAGSSLGLVVYLAVFLFAPFFQWFFKKFGIGGIVWFSMFIAASVIAFYGYDLYSLTLKALGRDEGLTGRTLIWGFGLSYINSNLLFGSGLGVFFSDNPSAPAQVLWRQMRYYMAPSFHQGYIQLIAETGLVGSIPVIAFLFWALIRSFLNGLYALFAILFILAVANFGSSLLLQTNSFLFVVMIYLVCLHKNKLKESV